MLCCASDEDGFSSAEASADAVVLAAGCRMGVSRDGVAVFVAAMLLGMLLEGARQRFERTGVRRDAPAAEAVDGEGRLRRAGRHSLWGAMRPRLILIARVTSGRSAASPSAVAAISVTGAARTTGGSGAQPQRP
jgi:hypothetical protein